MELVGGIDQIFIIQSSGVNIRLLGVNLVDDFFLFGHERGNSLFFQYLNRAFKFGASSVRTDLYFFGCDINFISQGMEKGSVCMVMDCYLRLIRSIQVSKYTNSSPHLLMDYRDRLYNNFHSVTLLYRGQSSISKTFFVASRIQYNLVILLSVYLPDNK